MRLTSVTLLLLTASSSYALSIGSTQREDPSVTTEGTEGTTAGLEGGRDAVGVREVSDPCAGILGFPCSTTTATPVACVLGLCSTSSPPDSTLLPPQPSDPASLPGPLHSPSGNPSASAPTLSANAASNSTSVSPNQGKPGSAKGLSVPLVTLLGAVGLGVLL